VPGASASHHLPARGLPHGESVDELGYGLSQLSAEQQEVVRLRYWEEKSFKEIAEETGVSINTALGRIGIRGEGERAPSGED